MSSLLLCGRSFKSFSLSSAVEMLWKSNASICFPSNPEAMEPTSYLASTRGFVRLETWSFHVPSDGVRPSPKFCHLVRKIALPSSRKLKSLMLIRNSVYNPDTSSSLVDRYSRQSRHILSISRIHPLEPVLVLRLQIDPCDVDKCWCAPRQDWCQSHVVLAEIKIFICE